MSEATPQHEFPQFSHMSVFCCHRLTLDSLVRRAVHWGTGSQAMGHEPSKLLRNLSFLCWSNRHTLTHAVLHHHESTFIAFVTLAFEVPWGVHTLATATEVRRYAALINVCTKAASGSTWVSGEPSFLWNKNEESKGCPSKVSPLTDLCSSVLQSQEQSHCRTCT